MTDAPALRGLSFTVPAARIGLALAEPGQRLALATVVNRSPERRGDDTLAYDLDGADLGLVRTGRAPLLIEHRRWLNDLLGMVVDAWIEDAELRALVRFAPEGEADRIWRLLNAGFPLSASMGATLVEAVPTGSNLHGGIAYRVGRWRLTELSVVVFGQREEAFVRLLDRDETLPELAARLASGEEAARATARHGLHLDRWRAWASEVAPRLADELGVDPARLRDVLRYEVMAHGEALVREQASPAVLAPPAAEERAA